MLDAAWTGDILRYEQLYTDSAAVHEFLFADEPRSRQGVRVRPVRAMGEVCNEHFHFSQCFMSIYMFRLLILAFGVAVVNPVGAITRVIHWSFDGAATSVAFVQS